MKEFEFVVVEQGAGGYFVSRRLLGGQFSPSGLSLEQAEAIARALNNAPQSVQNGVTVKIKRLHPMAIIPSYATAGAMCFDLHAVLEDGRSVFVEEDSPVLIRTGLAFEIPQGYGMNIYSRSGHGFKHDTMLCNAVGKIDSDYRGEVMVRLTRTPNTKPEYLKISTGDRIAQAEIVPIIRTDFVLTTDELTETARGTGGFGSTGS